MSHKPTFFSRCLIFSGADWIAHLRERRQQDFPLTEAINGVGQNFFVYLHGYSGLLAMNIDSL